MKSEYKVEHLNLNTTQDTILVQAPWAKRQVKLLCDGS
jgi:hypothetical protein